MDLLHLQGPDASNVPSEILELIDRTFLFKIEVANSSNSIYEPSYRVKKISSDADLITQFVTNFPHPRYLLFFNSVYLTHSPLQCIKLFGYVVLGWIRTI